MIAGKLFAKVSSSTATPHTAKAQPDSTLDEEPSKVTTSLSAVYCLPYPVCCVIAAYCKQHTVCNVFEAASSTQLPLRPNKDKN